MLKALQSTEDYTRFAAAAALRRIASECATESAGSAVGAMLLGRLFEPADSAVELSAAIGRLLTDKVKEPTAARVAVGAQGSTSAETLQ